MKSKGIHLEYNKFYQQFPDKLKVVLSKITSADFKDLIIETIEEMG